MYAFYLGIADLAITIPAAAILTLLIEIPIVKLEKVFLVPNKLLKGSHFEEDVDDFEAIETKKQMIEKWGRILQWNIWKYVFSFHHFEDIQKLQQP